MQHSTDSCKFYKKKIESYVSYHHWGEMWYGFFPIKWQSHEWEKKIPFESRVACHEWQIGKFTIPHFSSVVVCHNYTVSVNLTLIKLNLNISTVGVISITPTVDISTVGVISITPTVDTSLLLVLCHNTYSRRCSMGFTFKWCHYISFHLQYCYGHLLSNCPKYAQDFVAFSEKLHIN